MLGLDTPVGAGPVRASAASPDRSVPHPATSMTTADDDSAPSLALAIPVIAMR
ncbi:hypothetical protein ABT025_11125 [Streptomyces sp. NPDC002809]|uniref:hypothetical protein n=1 Tax=Streptomyces sp. NPDC002809 TaxID=3154433 RepID=UPI0033303A71